MPLVRYQLGVSLDGFIAPKDGSVDWLNPYGPISGGFLQEWVKQIGGFVLGRATYEESKGQSWFSALGPAMVMTSRPLGDAPASVEAATDAHDAVARLSAKLPPGKDIWLFGGGDCAGRFYEADAIDLLELAVVPVALGEGRPLFANTSAQRTYAFVSSQPIGLGVTLNTYRKIG